MRASMYNANAMLMYIFMSHGILYYFFPDQHYNTSGWLVWIKYIIFLLIFSVSIINKPPSRLEILIFLSVFLIYSPGIIVHPDPEKTILVAQYNIPLLSIIIVRGILPSLSDNYINRTTLSLAIICLFSSAYDLVFGGLSDRFSYSGARASSIFVNPNNSAIVISLIGLTGIIYSKSSAKRIAISSISLFSLVLLGSKTGFLIFMFFIFYFYRSYFWGLMVIFSTAFIAFFDKILFYWTELGLRNVDGDSGSQRLHDWSKFGEMFNEASFIDAAFGQYKPGYAIDNCYFDMTYHLGVIAPTATLIIQLIAAYRSYFRSKFLFAVNITFFLAMLTTNILRLWPLGYIFWAVIASSLFIQGERNIEKQA